MNSESHPAKIDEATSERCLQYLLGELSTHQSTQFEQQLAMSPALGDELQRQSELLCMASNAISETQIVDTQLANADSATPGSATPWIEAIVALAACLLVAFVGWNLTKTSSSINALQEDVLIAQAWAVDTDAIVLGVASLEEMELEEDGDFEIEMSAFDDSLSWVSTAVESGVSIDG